MEAGARNRRRAVRVVVVVARTRAALRPSVPTDAAARAASRKRPVHARCVAVAVVLDGAGDCGADWVGRVVGTACAACRAGVVGVTRADASTEKRPAHSRRMAVAVALDRAWSRSAVGVSLVASGAHVARSSSVASDTRAGASSDKRPAHGSCVVVAVGDAAAWDGSTRGVAGVLCVAAVALRPSEPDAARAAALRHVVANDGRRVIAAVRRHAARDGEAGRVALVVRCAGLARRAGVSGVAVARAAR